jgi:hypothetical protein
MTWEAWIRVVFLHGSDTWRPTFFWGFHRRCSPDSSLRAQSDEKVPNMGLWAFYQAISWNKSYSCVEKWNAGFPPLYSTIYSSSILVYNIRRKRKKVQKGRTTQSPLPISWSFLWSLWWCTGTYNCWCNKGDVCLAWWYHVVPFIVLLVGGSLTPK